jgi:hypothetical protein
MWAVAETGMKRHTWERKILRRVCGKVVEQGIWRVRTKQELKELYKDLDIVADVKKKFGWIRHVVRMDQRRRVKKIFESKPEGSKKRGRPRLRWLEHVEMVTVGSLLGRMGSCNYGRQGSQTAVEPRSE